MHFFKVGLFQAVLATVYHFQPLFPTYSPFFLSCQGKKTTVPFLFCSLRLSVIKPLPMKLRHSGGWYLLPAPQAQAKPRFVVKRRRERFRIKLPRLAGEAKERGGAE
ncbi:MAG: hypothetical protein LBQ51_07255 [Desulfovibrio sp.]|jgi:hypothetical protein|nr:hypothetical protein [Desulfovibrio sp.]